MVAERISTSFVFHFPGVLTRLRKRTRNKVAHSDQENMQEGNFCLQPD